jgi:hypothetical protein
MLDLNNLKTKKTNKKPCVHVFRYRRNQYVSKGKIVVADEWIRMKRLSCKGDCVTDTTRCFSPFEDIDEVGLENVCINFPDHPEDGKLYQAVFRATDWEAGHAEEWEWNMMPFEPEKK